MPTRTSIPTSACSVTAGHYLTATVDPAETAGAMLDEAIPKPLIHAHVKVRPGAIGHIRRVDALSPKDPA